MCGKACQIPATMARDLPQPHTAYVWVCVWVCGWVSKRDGGCLLAVNMTATRKQSKHQRGTKWQNIQYLSPVKDRPYFTVKILSSFYRRQAADGEERPTVEEVNKICRMEQKQTFFKQFKERERMLNTPYVFLFSPQHLSLSLWQNEQSPVVCTQ